MTGAGTVDRIRQCEKSRLPQVDHGCYRKKVVCDDACRFAKYVAKHGSRANDMPQVSQTTPAAIPTSKTEKRTGHIRARQRGIARERTAEMNGEKSTSKRRGNL